MKQMNVFERYLSLWVAACMVLGVAIGKLAPGLVGAMRDMEFGTGSHINIPIAILIWLMIYPMMLKIDFASIRGVGKRPGGLAVTLVVNWLVKPFSMAFLGWLFFRHVFTPWIGPELASEYIAGVIILAAAPCTAMVFVWSYLSDGDPAYTLVQVAVNDLIMLVAFAPVVKFLVSGASGLQVPFAVLLYSVLIFVVIPLAAGSISRSVLIRRKGAEWFAERFLPFFQPVTVIALLLTLVAIFAFQAENITTRAFHVVLIAIPILIQVYFNSGLAYGLMKLFRIPYRVAAPGALIGASNFFELAVATAIALYGPGSGAALATVVGVLVEVPVMLSVCRFCVATRGWFEPAAAPRSRPRASLEPEDLQMSERWKLVLLVGAFALAFFLPIESPRMQGALLEGFWLLKDYARQHVILCLVPAFFIAGAIGQFVSQGAVLRYLGAKAPRPVAYGVASVSGSILAVCSCTVLPLFASIYRRGAGLGPATAFLYSGPAINVLAMILTARVLGLQLGLARAIGAVVFAVVVGVLMALLFRREEAERQRNGADPFAAAAAAAGEPAAAVAGRPLPRHHGGDPRLRQLGRVEPRRWASSPPSTASTGRSPRRCSSPSSG